MQQNDKWMIGEAADSVSCNTPPHDHGYPRIDVFYSQHEKMSKKEVRCQGFSK